MGRSPCCDKATVKKGPWTAEEDAKLKDFIYKNGNIGNWIALLRKQVHCDPEFFKLWFLGFLSSLVAYGVEAFYFLGLKRCGKSCRLRWLNYLRPNIKHGEFSDEEDRIICSIYASISSRWSIMASQLHGRTDKDIKNHWNTKLKKKLLNMNMILPLTTTRTNPQTTFQYGGGSGTTPCCVSQFYQGFRTPNPLLSANYRSFSSPENLESISYYLHENSTRYQIDYIFGPNNEETRFLSAPIFDQATTCCVDDYQLIDIAFPSNDSNFWGATLG